jgi:hypothetical protein
VKSFLATVRSDWHWVLMRRSSTSVDAAHTLPKLNLNKSDDISC